MTKKCCRCKEHKLLSLFGIDRTGKSKDGYRVRCKPCEYAVGKQANQASCNACPVCNNPKRSQSKTCKACWMSNHLDKTEKICTKCNQLLPLSEYGERPGKAAERRPRSACKVCEAEIARTDRKTWDEGKRAHNMATKKRWYEEDPQRARLQSIRSKLRNWGTAEPDVFILAKQLASITHCQICKSPFEETTAHIDHCHETNKLRGVLCGGCNTGLGYFKDNVLSLCSAILYLRKFSAL